MSKIIVRIRPKGEKRRRFESMFGTGPYARKLENFLFDKRPVGKAIMKRKSFTGTHSINTAGPGIPI